MSDDVEDRLKGALPDARGAGLAHGDVDAHPDKNPLGDALGQEEEDGVGHGDHVATRLELSLMDELALGPLG